jgi:glutamate/tyrosine decarboxylase-like PLP-dependent enzyme
VAPQDVTVAIDALLARALHHAEAYLRDLDDRPVAPRVGPDGLRAALAVPLPDDGLDPEQVLDELVAAADPGILNSGSGRFFGWVMGGTLPAALAADWMTSVWDQNAPIYATSPAAAIAEEVAGAWLKDVLRLPANASFALVTGSQMAHVTCLAAARSRLLADRGVDVEHEGLAGAPAIRVVTSELRHETIVRALRFLGIGSGAIRPVSADASGRIRLDDYRAALEEAPDAPTMVCLLAGELNTGGFDPFAEACELARARGAWVHVDGAFGLWAAASARRRHLLAGVELADSWATDGHKTLNTPYDSGYAFVADREAHRRSMAIEASYVLTESGVRSETDWTPEWSRRARAFATYAALRSLGRRGVEELVDRLCDHASRLVEGIGALPGAEIVAPPVVNQGLVRFRDPAGGDDDRYSDWVAERVRDSGEAWFGPVTWQGRRCMRVSVSSWRTTDEDVDRAVAAVGRTLAGSR